MTFSVNAYADDDSFAPIGSEIYDNIINGNFPESLRYTCKSDHTEFTISVLEGDINDDYKSGLLVQEDGLFLTLYKFSISERRWDWRTGGNNYSFIIKGNEGWYYDFTGKERVSSSAYFTCSKIEPEKFIESYVPIEPVESDKTPELELDDFDE